MDRHSMASDEHGRSPSGKTVGTPLPGGTPGRGAQIGGGHAHNRDNLGE